MSGRKIQTAKGLCIVDITKFLMEKKNCTDDVAYAQLMGMEFSRINILLKKLK